MKKIVFLFFLAYTHFSFATLPVYNAPVIVARANINDGYNLPALSFINNASPVINDRGDISFKVAGIAGESLQGLWVKTVEDLNGKILYRAPVDRFVTDPSINDQGKIAFNLFEEGVTDGLFILDSKTLAIDHVLPSKDLHLDNFTYPLITNNDEIYFRGTDENNIRSFFIFNSKLSTIFSEGNNTSYIFRPAVNDEGSIAFKARLGTPGQWDENSPDQIILLEDNIKKVIAEDKDSNPESLFLGFTNSVSLSASGMVAFTGVVEKNQKGIFLYHHGKIHTLAMEGQNNIAEIENFSVKVNDEGLVLFRAKDSTGKRSLFLADDLSVSKLISEGDEVESDMGKSKILLNQFYPGFGGEIDINLDGTIVFNCTLVRASDDRELGQAIFVMSAKTSLK
jgi:hypothetical protein